jgi:hypothetical protein
MSNQIYLLVQENVVTNTVVWDGNVNTWQPPSDATMLVQSITPTKIWKLNQDETEYVLVDSMGDASIGFIWNGSVATTNEPKPEYVAPSELPVTTIK